MRLRLICALALVSACHAPAPPAPRPDRALVGLRFPPLPAGHRDLGGFVLTGPDSVMYALIQVSNGGRSMMWLSRLTGHDSLGGAHWQVRSVLSLPQLRRDEAVVMADCALDGIPDPAIVAIGRWTEGDTVAAIRYAWRPDVARQRFDTLASTRVVCGFAEDRN